MRQADGPRRPKHLLGPTSLAVADAARLLTAAAMRITPSSNDSHDFPVQNGGFSGSPSAVAPVRSTRRSVRAGPSPHAPRRPTGTAGHWGKAPPLHPLACKVVDGRKERFGDSLGLRLRDVVAVHGGPADGEEVAAARLGLSGWIGRSYRTWNWRAMSAAGVYRRGLD